MVQPEEDKDDNEWEDHLDIRLAIRVFLQSYKENKRAQGIFVMREASLWGAGKYSREYKRLCMGLYDFFGGWKRFSLREFGELVHVPPSTLATWRYDFPQREFPKLS